MFKKCTSCLRARPTSTFQINGIGHEFARCDTCRKYDLRPYKHDEISGETAQDRVDRVLTEMWDYRLQQGGRTEPTTTLRIGFGGTARTRQNLSQVLSITEGIVK